MSKSYKDQLESLLEECQRDLDLLRKRNTMQLRKGFIAKELERKNRAPSISGNSRNSSKSSSNKSSIKSVHSAQKSLNQAELSIVKATQSLQSATETTNTDDLNKAILDTESNISKANSSLSQAESQLENASESLNVQFTKIRKVKTRNSSSNSVESVISDLSQKITELKSRKRLNDDQKLALSELLLQKDRRKVTRSNSITGRSNSISGSKRKIYVPVYDPTHGWIQVPENELESYNPTEFDDLDSSLNKTGSISTKSKRLKTEKKAILRNTDTNEIIIENLPTEESIEDDINRPSPEELDYIQYCKRCTQNIPNCQNLRSEFPTWWT